MRTAARGHRPGYVDPRPLEEFDRFGKTTVRRADRTGGASDAAADGQPLTVALANC